MRVAALLLDDLAEPLKTGARRDHVARATLTVGEIAGDATEHKHARGQFQRDIDQICWSAAFEHLEALDHFERVADRPSERRIHPRDDGFRLHA